MMVPVATAFAMVMMFLGTVAAPTNVEHTTVGWTHEELLEYLSLNDTTGWSGMSKVLYTTGTDLSGDKGVFPGLTRRSGDNYFWADDRTDCHNPHPLFGAPNFGCGQCVSAPTDNNNQPIYASSGHLWRQFVKGVYPTADWYQGQYCQGARIHHQGILRGQQQSCNSAIEFGVPNFSSAMLYQGC